MSFIWLNWSDDEESDFIGDFIECFCECGDSFICRYGIYIDNEYDAFSL